MTKRNTKERRQQVSTLVNECGEMTVEQLSSHFSTSLVTIRKDLAELEKQNLLLRRFGGAVALNQNNDKPSSSLSQQKLTIADKAANHIKDKSRIIIDSGKTTAALIPKLSDKKNLVVMTNSLTVANQLQSLSNEPTILMTGGTWDPHSESFQGQVAEQALRCYDFDQLFIGADGIDINRGTTTFNELISLSRVMAKVAKEVIVMIESEKIGRRIPNLELEWANINTLITDDGISQETIKQLQANNINVLIAA